MVYAVGIEILCHLTETISPPRVAVLAHLLPIIYRETPILSCNREIIRWCAGARIHNEEVWRYPRINTTTAHADRYIPFECYTLTMGKVNSLVQLSIEMVLQESVKVNLFTVLLLKSLATFYIVRSIFAPGCEICRVVKVSQYGVDCIWC